MAAGSSLTASVTCVLPAEPDPSFSRGSSTKDGPACACISGERFHFDEVNGRSLTIFFGEVDHR